MFVNVVPRAFSRDEYTARLLAVRREMVRRGFDQGSSLDAMSCSGWRISVRGHLTADMIRVENSRLVRNSMWVDGGLTGGSLKVATTSHYGDDRCDAPSSTERL